MLSHKAQALSVETILILIVFTAILSILSIYLWGIIQKSTKVIKSVTQKEHYNEFASELRQLYFSGEYGKLKLFVPEGKSLVVGFYELSITNNTVGRVVLINDVDTALNSPKSIILIINDKDYLLANADKIREFVKNGGILVIDASKIDVISYDLFNVKKYITYDNYTLNSNELIIYTKPFYDNYRTTDFFKNSSGVSIRYSLLPNVSLNNLELIEYFSTDDKIYPIVFKQFYGLGAIYYSLDKKFLYWIENNTYTLPFLSEAIKTDENNGYFESEYRIIINPLFKKYYYIVYSCSNIMIFSKGFTRVKVYKTNNTWTDILNQENLSLIYETYFELYTIIPITSCGTYLIETTSPSVIYVLSKSGGFSLMGTDVIVPVSSYIYVCGINTSFSIIDLKTQKTIVYMNYMGKYGGCYKKLVSPGLYRIKASPNPVIIYAFTGFDKKPENYVDVINPPYYTTANGKKVYIFPQIYIKDLNNDTIINYVAVIYSKPDKKQKIINIYEFDTAHTMYYSKTINSTEILLFTTNNKSTIVIEGPEDIDIQLVPLFYNSSGYLKDVTSHGGIFTPDNWIILTLRGSPEEVYKLLLYTSVSSPKLEFMAYESDYSSLDIFNVFNPSVSNLKTVTTVKFYKAHIYRKVYNCSLPINNKIFLTIDNNFLDYLGKNGYCTCYNKTGDVVDCALYPPHFEKKFVYYVHEQGTLQVI